MLLATVKTACRRVEHAVEGVAEEHAVVVSTRTTTVDVDDGGRSGAHDLEQVALGVGDVGPELVASTGRELLQVQGGVDDVTILGGRSAGRLGRTIIDHVLFAERCAEV